ncbi:MAG: transglycosylase SLT domain-containing protein [Alphaproteobacteria bacterium]
MQIFITFLIITLNIGSAWASCINAIRSTERTHSIPKDTLLAISIVESGRWDKKSKKYKPWPWTINVQGKPYFFDSKQEAVNFAKKQLKKGIKNMDIGCMQINYRHHGHHFGNLYQMFDPLQNARYAAKLLRQHKNEPRATWSKAVGNYHSKTVKHHNRYRAQYQKALAKVRGQQQEAVIRQAKGTAFSRQQAKMYFAKAKKKATDTTFMPIKRNKGGIYNSRIPAWMRGAKS